MKSIIISICLLLSVASQAQEKMKMNFVSEQLPKIIEHYSKATGQKFIVDATVRGAITILNSEEVSYDEAFNSLSEALAINGFAMVKKDNVFMVRNARSSQRDGIEVVTSVPKAKPERMITWITTFNNVSAHNVRTQLGRMLNSSYGEIEVSDKTNQVIVTDWSSSIVRISELFKQIDQPVNPALEKIIAKEQKERDLRKKNEAKAEIKKTDK
jgi:type II secretory pathway component GspD/PulD (secretin)